MIKHVYLTAERIGRLANQAARRETKYNSPENLGDWFLVVLVGNSWASVVRRSESNGDNLFKIGEELLDSPFNPAMQCNRS